MAGGAGGSLFRKAPLVLRHFPGVLAGIVGATAVLALAASSAPLFFSSASNLAVARRVHEVSPWQAGLMLRLRAPAEASHEVFTSRTEAVRKLARDIDHLGDPVTTMLTASTVRPAEGAQGSPVQAVARSGERAHIQLLARLSGERVDVVPDRVADPLRDCAGPQRESSNQPGVLMADSLALQLEVCPGDEVVVAGSTPVPVAGIYRDLREAPRDAFWDLLAPQYEPEIAPTFLLMGSSTFQELASRFDGAVLYRWEAPVEVPGLTFDDAQTLADRLRTVIREVDSGSHLLPPTLFPGVHADSLWLNIRSVVQQTVSGSRAPVNFLSLGGMLLALGVTSAAGTYASHRRRTEFALLHTRGVAPAVLGARSSLEALLPATAGCLLGWTAAMGIVRLLGPADLLGNDALLPALGRAAASVAAGVVLLGVVTAAGLRARTGMSLRRVRALVAAPWDVGLLLLAYVTWRRLSLMAAHASSDTSRTLDVDVLVFVFPMLFVAGVAGLVSRLLRAVLPRLKVSGSTLRPPLFLALRRLAAAPAIALTLVLIAAVSIGAFLYAGILATSGRATVEAKALTFVGSDVSVPLPPNPEVPEGVHSPATIVSKVSQIRLMPGAIVADVLGVDPATFAGVAFWDDSFANESLERLLQRIRWDPRNEAVPAVVTGLATDQRDMTLENSEDIIDLQVLDVVRSFPGIFSTRPMVVLDRRALEPREGGPGGTTVAGAGASYEMWLAGRPNSIIDELARAGVSLEGSRTATAAEDTPSLLPLQWSFGFLQGLGAVSGLMALVGILLYLQARQASRVVAGALVARMGLSRGEHALSIATELALMLLIAFSLGTTLSVVAANLVYDLIDPLPIVPPPPLLRIPTELVVVIAALLLATAVAGAWRVQRASDRANVAEVLRVAA